MSKALFFNALPDATSLTGYDRNYNADDISDWLSVIWESGVCKTNTANNNEPQGLKVIAQNNSMVINVNAGKAAIKGKAFISNALESFTVANNGTTAPRYDYIVIRYDNNLSVRNIELKLVTGTSAKPTVANLTRSDNIYELMLGYIAVAPSVTRIEQSNITDTRGDKDLCPWFTAIKGYEDYYDAIVQTHESEITLTNATYTVITDMPSSLYNSRYSMITVYTNGLKEPTSAYTIDADGQYILIAFSARKAAGAVITLELDNFIDGEGMTTALAQYEQLVKDVAEIKTGGEYTYVCNGVNDNILIGDIVREYLSGGTDYGSLKLNIVGNIGMTAAASGAGTGASPYAWFNFTKSTEPTRKIILDFSNGGVITPPITKGTYNIIFDGRYMHLIGANVVAEQPLSDTIIKVFGAGYGTIQADNCRFWVFGYRDSNIAYCGTFNNCYGNLSNYTNNSFCFQTNTNGLLRVNGGEYYAYTRTSSAISAIVAQSGADAVSILYGVNAPTSAKSNYYQTHSIYQYTGGGMINCTDLVSALPLSVVSGLNNTRGTIVKSKAGLM